MFYMGLYWLLLPWSYTCPPHITLLFSTFQGGFCFWQQLTDDSFDWSRQSKGTPSLSTGPKADHTTGGSNGMSKLLYIYGIHISRYMLSQVNVSHWAVYIMIGLLFSAGYYIYIEASSTNGRQPNDTARLASASNSMFSSGDMCIQWWYHMYGTHVGQLSLYLSGQTSNGKCYELII